MQVKVEIDEQFIVEAIEDYCSKHCRSCPSECVFDKIGVCTEHNAFNDIADKYRHWLAKNK